LAQYLRLHLRELMVLALRNTAPRNYRKNATRLDSKNFSAGAPG